MNNNYIFFLIIAGAVLVLFGVLYSLFIRPRPKNDPRWIFGFRESNKLYDSLFKKFSWKKLKDLMILEYRMDINMQVWITLIFIVIMSIILVTLFLAPKSITDTLTEFLIQFFK